MKRVDFVSYDDILPSALNIMERKILSLPPLPPGQHYEPTAPKYEFKDKSLELHFDIIVVNDKP